MSKESKTIFGVALAIFAAWILSGFLLYDDENRGTFGDMFGAINALFSGFAFLGVIYAIHLQRQELSLQRKELELTRAELERAADAQAKSEKALSLQADVMAKTHKLQIVTTAIDKLSEQRSNFHNVPGFSANETYKQTIDFLNELEMILANDVKFIIEQYRESK